MMLRRWKNIRPPWRFSTLSPVHTTRTSITEEEEEIEVPAAVENDVESFHENVSVGFLLWRPRHRGLRSNGA